MSSVLLPLLADGDKQSCTSCAAEMNEMQTEKSCVAPAQRGCTAERLNTGTDYRNIDLDHVRWNSWNCIPIWEY